MTSEKTPPSPLVVRYFLFIFILTILLVGRLFWPFLSILVFSYLLTGIFKPLYTLLCRRLSPIFSSLITCLLITVIVFVPLTLFVGALSREAYALYLLGKGTNVGLKLKEILQENAVLAQIQGFLANFGLKLEPDGFSQTLSDLAKGIGFFLYNQASSWAANVMQFIFNFLMMILTIFFLLIDHERLINYILQLSPLPDDQERRLIDKFEEISWAVLIGNGVSGLFQGVMGGLLFVILGLPSPVLWGGIMAILAFLPIFGIGLVLVPTAFILLLKGHAGSFVFVIVFYMLLSFSVEYLIKPKMVGSQVKMHTLLVFFSILGGLSAFGFMGIIYGPLIITAFLTLADIYLANYDVYVKGLVAPNSDE